MNIKQQLKYKQEIKDFIADRKVKGKAVIEMFCPHCKEIVETAVAPVSTWKNPEFDYVTKVCQECLGVSGVKIYADRVVTHKFDCNKVKHIMKIPYSINLKNA
jgi:hypothetical protein